MGYYSDIIVIARLLQIKWMQLLRLKNTVGSVCDNEEHMWQKISQISHYVYARQACISKRKSLT